MNNYKALAVDGLQAHAYSDQRAEIIRLRARVKDLERGLQDIVNTAHPDHPWHGTEAAYGDMLLSIARKALEGVA